MSLSELVAPRHRPTLADLLPGRRLAAVVAAGALLAAYPAWRLVGPENLGTRVVETAPVALNLRYEGDIARVAPQGEELLRLERSRADGLFLDSLAVEPLALPPYEGDISGLLPLVADREMQALKERFTSFELVQEGKARINEVPGYTISFRALRGERRLFGRLSLLPEPVPGPRRGVRLLLVATPASGAANPSEVGSRGAIRVPYRTFRFGTEAP